MGINVGWLTHPPCCLAPRCPRSISARDAVMHPWFKDLRDAEREKKAKGGVASVSPRATEVEESTVVDETEGAPSEDTAAGAGTPWLMFCTGSHVPGGSTMTRLSVVALAPCLRLGGRRVPPHCGRQASCGSGSRWGSCRCRPQAREATVGQGKER